MFTCTEIENKSEMMIIYSMQVYERRAFKYIYCILKYSNDITLLYVSGRSEVLNMFDSSSEGKHTLSISTMKNKKITVQKKRPSSLFVCFSSFFKSLFFNYS